MTTTEQNEALRKAVLIFLAKRQAFDFTISGIRQGVIDEKVLDFRPEHADIKTTMAFLEGYQFVKRKVCQMGSTESFTATTEGVLFYERNYA